MAAMSNPAHSMPPHYTSLGPFAGLFRQGLPILTYHVVGPRPWGARLKGLYVSPRLFARQLAELRQTGYTTPGYGAVGEPIVPDSRQCLITMDDATRKTGEHALPILLQHECRAIQFVVADRIGGTNDWQTAKGEVEEPLMDEVHIHAWLDAGQDIGAHTMTHPWLTRIPRAQAREEITASKKLLEDRFGRRIDHFCYPYGDHDEGIMDLVGEAGYLTACTTEPGINTPDTPRLALKRIMARYPSRSLRTVKAWFKRSS
jgi:peptidoglycan/xylan/chitin deacetylase (PgdA/CDA1 family)